MGMHKKPWITRTEWIKQNCHREPDSPDRGVPSGNPAGFLFTDTIIVYQTGQINY